MFEMLPCPKCGVPLRKSEDGEALASCKYCGSVSLIVSREPSPEDGAPPAEPPEGSDPSSSTS